MEPTTPLLGQIILFAGSFAPTDWAFCHGQLLDISSHTNLYTLLGTTYGGDGLNNFALPDFRGRVPISVGKLNGNSTFDYHLGEKEGEEKVKLTVAQLPAHTHDVLGRVEGKYAFNCSTSDGTSKSPKNNFFGKASNLYASPANISIDLPIKTFELGAEVQTLPSGGGQDHENMAPFQVINYIIATKGTYPTFG